MAKKIDYDIDDYEFRGDVDYTPNKNEKCLMQDYLNGYLEEFIKTICTHFGQPKEMLDRSKLCDFLIDMWEEISEKQLSYEGMLDELADSICRRFGVPAGKEKLQNSLRDLIDTIQLHSLPEIQGDYRLVNDGELEQAVERSMAALDEFAKLNPHLKRTEP